MDNLSILHNAQVLLAAYTDKVETPEENRIDIYLAPEKLVEAVQVIIAAGGWHLSAITGLDIPQSAASEGEIELLYHFCQRAAVVTLRVRVLYGLPEAPTICGIIPSANIYEREVVEMLGVIITGTPIRRKILLPDDWPDSVYPLRKSFTGLDSM
jgi:NADH:ubiquinone oxidoreductase subunit C